MTPEHRSFDRVDVQLPGGRLLEAVLDPLAGLDLKALFRALEEASATEGGTGGGEAETPRRKRTARPRSLHERAGDPLQTERRRSRARRWPGAPEWWIAFRCRLEGIQKGGRPPRERRCTKRLGSRLCWGWRTADGDRCRLHPRA